MMGPMAYVQHLLSGPRLPFTGAYLGSMALSLYFAIGVSQKKQYFPGRIFATVMCALLLTSILLLRKAA